MRHGHPPAFAKPYQTALGTDGKTYEKKKRFRVLNYLWSWLPWAGKQTEYRWTLLQGQRSDHDMMKQILEYLSEYEKDGDLEKLKSGVTGDHGDLLTSPMNTIFGGIQY